MKTIVTVGLEFILKCPWYISTKYRNDFHSTYYIINTKILYYFNFSNEIKLETLNYQII